MPSRCATSLAFCSSCRPISARRFSWSARRAIPTKRPRRWPAPTSARSRAASLGRAPSCSLTSARLHPRPLPRHPPDRSASTRGTRLAPNAGRRACDTGWSPPTARSRRPVGRCFGGRPSAACPEQCVPWGSMDPVACAVLNCARRGGQLRTNARGGFAATARAPLQAFEGMPTDDLALRFAAAQMPPTPVN